MSDPAQGAEDAIIRSWHVNAAPWTEAIRSRSIASRRLVTDGAIIETVAGLAPRRVLDIGCGEGWLARALSARGMEVVGVDAVPALIAEARRLGGGVFTVHSYGDLVAGALRAGTFDAAVCNFSLLGKDSVEALIRATAAYLGAAGHLVLQTLHPVAACGDQPYADGWRSGSWIGFAGVFRDPAPWYFRTCASWYAMLRRCGFTMVEVREPTAVGAFAPSSLICVGRQSAGAAPA